MSEDEKSRHDSEYQSLVALYISLLKSLHTDGEEEALYDLSEKRTEIAFGYVLDGLGIDYDEALALLQNESEHDFTQHDKDMRDRVKAALLNLIDFSVCQQYQLYSETLDEVGENEIDFNSEDYEDLLALCGKYNDTYSAIENSDIKYAGKMAAMWIGLSASDWLVYWTMNDIKVRPWHMALQGYAAPRDEFPSWMIPPIEYNCRCFLECLEVPRASAKMKNAMGLAKNVTKPRQIDDVYSESLAKCGRIFGPSHSYFSVKASHKDLLDGFVSRLKEKYYA